MEKEGYYKIKRDCIDWFREDYYFLSNFYPAKMTFEGIPYESSEGAYQAQKLAKASERVQFSHLCSDEAKRLGQVIEIRPDWEEVKRDIMEQIVKEKFIQNPILAHKLMETGELPLMEGNHWGDVYWGIDSKTREGENHLGKILMALREQFRKNEI